MIFQLFSNASVEALDALYGEFSASRAGIGLSLPRGWLPRGCAAWFAWNGGNGLGPWGSLRFMGIELDRMG
jgi:hypothetical protein